jgi:hypothetical protein
MVHQKTVRETLAGAGRRAISKANPDPLADRTGCSNFHARYLDGAIHSYTNWLRDHRMDGVVVTRYFFWCDFHPYVLPSVLMISWFVSFQASGLLLIDCAGDCFAAGVQAKIPTV